MSGTINALLGEYVEEVSKIYGEYLKSVILYGSYARGDFRSDSDIDIMILTDLEDEEIVQYRSKILDYAYEIENEHDFKVELSPLIKNIEKYNKRIDVVPFYMNVQKEGVILHG